MEELNNNPEERFVVSDTDVNWAINGQEKTPEEINMDLKAKREKLQNEALEKYLIIGSVVGIEGSFDKLMITGYKVRNENNEIKDYVACKYPNGSTEKLVCFNHEDIKRIYFIGFTTEYGNKFKSELDSNNEDLEKGKIM